MRIGGTLWRIRDWLWWRFYKLRHPRAGRSQQLPRGIVVRQRIYRNLGEPLDFLDPSKGLFAETQKELARIEEGLKSDPANPWTVLNLPSHQLLACRLPLVLECIDEIAKDLHKAGALDADAMVKLFELRQLAREAWGSQTQASPFDGVNSHPPGHQPRNPTP